MTPLSLEKDGVRDLATGTVEPGVLEETVKAEVGSVMARLRGVSEQRELRDFSDEELIRELLIRLSGGGTLAGLGSLLGTVRAEGGAEATTEEAELLSQHDVKKALYVYCLGRLYRPGLPISPEKIQEAKEAYGAFIQSLGTYSTLLNKTVPKRSTLICKIGRNLPDDFSHFCFGSGAASSERTDRAYNREEFMLDWKEDGEEVLVFLHFPHGGAYDSAGRPADSFLTLRVEKTSPFYKLIQRFDATPLPKLYREVFVAALLLITTYDPRLRGVLWSLPLPRADGVVSYKEHSRGFDKVNYTFIARDSVNRGPAEHLETDNRVIDEILKKGLPE